jgi:hypothetical protein
MIGTHDFDLRLRNLLIAYMDKNKAQLKAIWKTERIRTDKKYGIESEEKTLDSVSRVLFFLLHASYCCCCCCCSTGMG